jgi:hypothetical protein
VEVLCESDRSKAMKKRASVTTDEHNRGDAGVFEIYKAVWRR